MVEGGGGGCCGGTGSVFGSKVSWLTGYGIEVVVW